MLKRKNFLRRAVLLLFVAAVFAGLTVCASAQNLDEIQSYEVRITPREDASLDMDFTIVWTVLDSDSEGPLEWVKIGIPNMYVDEIRASSSTAAEVSYYTDGGAYVRVDLDRAYYAGETVEFSFSIHQSRMFTLENGNVRYDYTPGWFDEIEVRRLRVYWASQSVAASDAPAMDGDFLMWSSALREGERMSLSVTYPQSAFTSLDPEMVYSERYIAPWKIITICSVIAVFTAAIVIALVVSSRNSDPYESCRGFTGADQRVYVGHTNVVVYRGVGLHGVRFGADDSGSGGGRTGSSCACACACACAGGGRAGCSRKDMYGAKMEYAKLLSALRKKEQ